MGVPAVVAYGLVENLAENLPRCVAQAGEKFDRQGFAGAEGLAAEIAADAEPRCEVLARASELLRAGNH